MLRQAIARTGLSSFAELERELLEGHALLWIAARQTPDGVVIEAVASTALQSTDAGKVCVITACAGEGMARWLPLLADIERYAKDEGCICVRIFGRKGWLRALDGYRQRHAILDKALG